MSKHEPHNRPRSHSLANAFSFCALAVSVVTAWIVFNAPALVDLHARDEARKAIATADMAASEARSAIEQAQWAGPQSIAALADAWIAKDLAKSLLQSQAVVLEDQRKLHGYVTDAIGTFDMAYDEGAACLAEQDKAIGELARDLADFKRNASNAIDERREASERAMVRVKAIERCVFHELPPRLQAVDEHVEGLDGAIIQLTVRAEATGQKLHEFACWAGAFEQWCKKEFSGMCPCCRRKGSSK